MRKQEKQIGRRSRKAGKIFLVGLLVVGCTASQAKTAWDVADDVFEIAKILCLQDHAAERQVKASLVRDLCATSAQIEPYMGQAKRAGRPLFAKPPCGER